MPQDLIFHLLPKENWRSLIKDGAYSPESLEEERFIHCSTGDKIEQTANTLFSDEDNLWMLIIDSKRVVQPIKYEKVEQKKEKFPHIYGALNLDAILDKISLSPNKEGKFEINFSSR